MLLRESGGGAEQPRLRVGDQLHRHFVHPPLEAALGDEAIAEARARQIIGEPLTDAAGDDDRDGALGERKVAGNRTEAEA
jgi:hypothetical protein